MVYEDGGAQIETKNWEAWYGTGKYIEFSKKAYLGGVALHKYCLYFINT